MNNKNKFDWLSSDFQGEPIPEKSEPAQQDEQQPINTDNLTEDKMQKNTTKNVVTKNIPTKNPVSNNSVQKKNTRLGDSIAPASVEETKSLGRDGKRSNPDYKVVGVQLSVSLHRRAKEILLQQGEEKNFSDLINELLEDWINSEN